MINPASSEIFTSLIYRSFSVTPTGRKIPVEFIYRLSREPCSPSRVTISFAE
jgi:hypothetical protein